MGFMADSRRFAVLMGAALVALFSSISVHAQTFSFTVGDIAQFVADSRTSGKPLSRLLGDQVQQVLDQQGIRLTEEALFWQRSLDDVTLRSGCTARTVLSRQHVSAQLSADSSFAVQLEALAKPIVATMDIYGTVEVDGRVTVRLGHRVLGKCIRYDKETLDVSANADVAMTMSLILRLNPVVTPVANGLQISFDPTAELKGEFISITNKAVDFRVRDFSPLLRLLDGRPFGGILGRALDDGFLYFVESYAESNALTVNVANSNLAAWLATTQSNLNANLNARSFFVPYVAVDLAKELLRFVNRYPLRFPVSYEFLRDNQDQVLRALYLGDGDQLVTLLGTSVACQASGNLFRDMSIAPLPAGTTDFQATSLADYCSEVAVDSKRKLGNADIWDGDTTLITERPWTLTPGNRLDVGVLSIGNNNQPYMKRVNYKTIRRYTRQIAPQTCEWLDSIPRRRVCNGPLYTQVETTPCKLEMRVYRKDLAANNQRAAIAVHGGSWKYRGAAFLGLESQISHLTQRGFVVFAPFYRLVGSSDGNLECNDAKGADILQDMNDAFAWVQTNKTRFGAAANNDVYVMGQSAGAHLAGILAVEHPSEVKRALMLYSPTDARDIISRYQQVPPVVDSPEALSILEDYLGQSVKTVNTNDAFVARNSLPTRIADSSTRSRYFLIHGRADPLVPSRQSVRLCNALSKSSSAADFDVGPATNDGGNAAAGVYRKRFTCSGSGVNSSKLHLIAEAEHALDLCIPLVSCPAGSLPSVSAARQSMSEGYNWLAERSGFEALAPILDLILD
ncbi:hypothetical protein GCM10011487_18530 [Steroidobacter agaridevorans]|uniref:BD-FAE-like domain-containing protein n=1 Tax=Steroidobacter agaridevorans TaxID=2695856 RepID=A0A829YA37_9GAMM|nr:alpha/beta hydrolase [Steroidobacter agaridevorans]GFE79853.1 hypothetical protein GCM10011487_18530 [Steroidobacter agaridevorans]GFE90179.1 hypothetical protein GCM10011488_51330 [Steroidobacter agaridevorans]